MVGSKLYAAFMAGVALAGAGTAQAKPVKVTSVTNGAKALLGQASDKALDKLAVPGSFYNDMAIRILLPGAAGSTVSSVLNAGEKLGLTGDLTKKINDAAGLAAGEAKPIFRSAIDRFSLTDAPGLVLKSDGGTQYLKKAASPELRAKVRPLIVSALGKVGAFGQLDKLGSLGGALGGLGLTQDKLTDSVTDQALNGIFKYMGAEEAGLRGNPLGAGKKLLGGVLK